MARYSEIEARVVASASAYARQSGRANPYTIHLLYALIHEEDVRQFLMTMNIDPNQMLNRLRGLGHESDPYSYASARPTVPKTVRNILKRGQALALTLNANKIVSLHLLYGVTQEQSTPAAKFLESYEIDSSVILDHIVSIEKIDEQSSPGTNVIESIPPQTPAPIVIEVRSDLITSVDLSQGELSARRRDFDRWRAPVHHHLIEMLSDDFRSGTNHSRVRERLSATSRHIAGTIDNVLENQFYLGYEIERLGRLIEIYQTAHDDLPGLNEASLQDLIHVHVQLMLGSNKLDDWSRFRSAAENDMLAEGDVNPEIVDGVATTIANIMQQQDKKMYFADSLPTHFRSLAEAVRDPWGTTHTIIYGTVKSIGNLVSFLGQTALSITKATRDAITKPIGAAIAGILLSSFGEAALRLSSSLPTEWKWLKPLLEIVAKLHV